MSKAILYDATMCIDCKLCEKACAERNHLPYNNQIAAEEKISPYKLTYVKTKGDKFMRRLCMNCEDPTCASVCPVAALRKTPEGPVTYDASRCIGCRYCMLACPFEVPKYEWSSPLPRVRKCDMCADRVASGKKAACAEPCPTGATTFGERDELIAEAKKRTAKNPNQYINHIYGLNEVGGTSVLLLSRVPFAEFGYPGNLPHQPLPMLTYRTLSKIPDLVALGVYAVMRFEDLLNRGVLPMLLHTGYETDLFYMEVMIGLLLPIFLLLSPRIRETAGGLYFCSVLVLLGFVTNRLNVSITGMEGAARVHYIPKWTEFAVTASIIAAGFTTFAVAVKYLPISPEGGEAKSFPPSHRVAVGEGPLEA